MPKQRNHRITPSPRATCSSSSWQASGKLVVGDPYFVPGVPIVIDRHGLGAADAGDLAVVRTGRGRARRAGARPGGPHRGRARGASRAGGRDRRDRALRHPRTVHGGSRRPTRICRRSRSTRRRRRISTTRSPSSATVSSSARMSTSPMSPTSSQPGTPLDRGAMARAVLRLCPGTGGPDASARACGRPLQPAAERGPPRR